MNSLSPQAATARSAAESANTSQTAAPIGTIPAIHFSHYHVLGDGDCLFRAMYMGLSNQPGVEPNQDQVMGLRQHLANYVYQNQQALTKNPIFEGLLGVQNLYDLLVTPGQWNHNAGNLVAPLLAQVSGRPVVVLQPTQEGAAYDVRQVFPAENPALPPGLALSGEPSICLAHINSKQYAYLEARYPSVLLNALSQLTRGAGEPALGQAAPEKIESASIRTPPSGHKKVVRTQLTYIQEREAIQLWHAHPDWGTRRVADEYMKRNPGLTVGRNHIQALKRRYPDLLDAGLGSKMQTKRLNLEEERALAQLWQKNPRWGERKLANEFKCLHPNSNVTKDVVSKVKKRNPALHKLAPGSSLQAKKLSEAQENNIAEIWLSKPSWSAQKIVVEFNKGYPESKVSVSSVLRLKKRHPSLQGISLGPEKIQKKLNFNQEQQVLQLWRDNPKWANRKIAETLMEQNPGVSISHAVIKRVKAQHPDFLKQSSAQFFDISEEDVLSPGTLATLGDIFMDELPNEPNPRDEDNGRLLLDNPTWDNRKITETLIEQNPGMSTSHTVTQSVGALHPDFLKQSSAQFFDIPEEDVLSPRTLGTLSDIFMDALPNEPNPRDEDNGRRATQGGAAID